MKQPQNLAALTHFLALGQRLDAAVLIDGFGVAALSFHNVQLGYQPEAPSIAAPEAGRSRRQSLCARREPGSHR